MKKEIARFAPEVCAAAESGDPAARRIVAEQAEDLAELLAAGVREAVDREALDAGIALVQCGGVFANALYREALIARVHERLRLDDRAVDIRWRQVTTGSDAATNLARQLWDAPDAMLRVGPEHRPLIVGSRA
jgi:N-acetylglucosamine kinase-like BadF-type ATPase